MKITVLMEDTCCRSGLTAEHGFSLYIETARHTLLMDTGASDATWRNAEALGVDLGKADTVVISHGHYDHAGGLLTFASLNPTADIWLRRSATGAFYHGERYIGMDPRIADLPRVHWVDSEDEIRLDEELSLFAGTNGRTLWPSSNLELHERTASGQLVQDPFLHEQNLVIREGGRCVLLSGCAHNGVWNILSRFSDIFHTLPDVVVSGFHMARKAGYNPEDISAMEETARRLADTGTVFYTGHCTGDEAFSRMQPILGDRLRRIRTGDVIEL